MLFLIPEDFDFIIREEDLSVITGQDTSLLDHAERLATEEVAGYLRHRYDVDAIMATTGDDRQAQLVSLLVDITLYHLHSRISARNIPDLRVKRYDDAIMWLKMVANGAISPDLPVIAPEQGKRTIWGSNTKKENYL